MSFSKVVISFSLLALSISSSAAMAECAQGSTNCTSQKLFESKTIIDSKAYDRVWNNIPEMKKEANVERISRLYESAKSNGEQALGTPVTDVSNSTKRHLFAPKLVDKTDGLSDTWCVVKDLHLSENMTSWAKKAHWTVKWNADYDYPIDSAFCVSGSFQQAVQSVAQVYKNANRVLKLDLYPRQAVAVFTTK